MPVYAVCDLYEEMLEFITKMIIDEEIDIIDIDEIESKLITEKYEKMWISNGYIEVDANGSW